MSILLGIGCSTDTRTFRGLTTDAATSRLGAVIYPLENAQCKKAEKKPAQEQQQAGQREGVAAPLIAAGISMGITLAVDAINKSIEDYKKGLSNIFAAGGNSPDVAGNIKCLVVARGLIGQAIREKDKSNDKASNNYRDLGFSDYPSFYLELKTEHKGNTVVLTPQFLSYAASSARKEGSGFKHVSLVLSFSDISPKGPSENSEEKAFAVFRHDLGRLEIGKSYDEKLLIGTAASAFLKDEDLKRKGFNISAVVTESEEAGLAYQVAAEAYASKKADLQKAMEDTLTKAIGINNPNNQPK